MLGIHRTPYVRAAIVVLLLASLSILAPIACASNRDIINKPQSSPADKGNPKLDSRLNQLVSAERRGELAAFARQSNIELFNGEVRVIIECVPGQLEAATAAATGAGAKLETSYDNLLQVRAPVASLNALAEAGSIRFIRLPRQPLPAAKG
ncbi:MAG: hypothetical protein HY668_01395 [Chloroflexi bacterium]|nr:hypothetical protein [Chloroflexota bacterium]